MRLDCEAAAGPAAAQGRGWIRIWIRIRIRWGSPFASGARARTLDTAPTIIIIASAHLTYDSSSTPLEAMLDTSPSSNFFLSEMLLFRGEHRTARKGAVQKKTFRNRGGHNLAEARSRGDGDGDGDGERRARG